MDTRIARSSVPLSSPSSLNSHGATTTGWASLNHAALYGLAGQIVRTISPHTEADGAALLLTFLSMFGNEVGPEPHAVAGSSLHPARLNVVLVGDTSRSRKGTAAADVRRIMAAADPLWTAERIQNGLASGEGLIHAVRDHDLDAEDEGVTDKRLFVLEPEYARVLGVAQREGNTLSAVIREAWDSGRLRVMTRRNPLSATGAHISLLGHITTGELTRRMSETEAVNGFCNRILFACVRRSKYLPRGGDLQEHVVSALGERVGAAAHKARGIRRMYRSRDAELLWEAMYEAFEDHHGLVGAITARPEAQTLRLSVAYALLDGSEVIDVNHLNAAKAVWDYCEASALRIFGDRSGDPIEDRLLEGLREAGTKGLTATEQSALFGRHVSGDRLRLVRKDLEERAVISTEELPTRGRFLSVSRLCETREVSELGL